MSLIPIPDEINEGEPWLLDYWSEKLGVSRERLIELREAVGPKIKKIEKLLNEGYRIAIEDENGKAKLAARVGFLKDGFHLSVPYFNSSSGLLMKTKIDYSKDNFDVPFSEAENYTVSDHVKLSLHMTGFVQFSTLGKPIISGFNQQLQQIKGVGVRAPDEVWVTTGPLCGVIVQGLCAFEEPGNKTAEVFKRNEFWHHPLFSTEEDTAINIEIFMFPRSELRLAENEDGHRTYVRTLPFKSKFKFPFHLRVLEIPHLPFFLGIIVSPVRADSDKPAGYKIGGPGCFDKNGNAYSIGAWYPPPSCLPHIETRNLDYTNEQPNQTP